MDQLITVLIAIAIVTGATSVLIPMLSATPSPERKAERDAALEAQLIA